MPNHVINELTFNGVSRELQDAIVASLCGTEGKVDFAVLVPPPLNIWMGNASSEHNKAFRTTWYEWNRDNWGTKWNAYSHQETVRGEDAITLIFETAWAPPYPWLAAVFNKIKLPFEHRWLDEGALRARHGRFWTDERMGMQWREEEAGDDDHRRLHKMHWGVESFEDEGEGDNADAPEPGQRNIDNERN